MRVPFPAASTATASMRSEGKTGGIYRAQDGLSLRQRLCQVAVTPLKPLTKGRFQLLQGVIDERDDYLRRS